MTALAAELKIYLAVGLTEADGDTRYNTVVLIGPDGKVIGRYRKQEVERNEAARNTAGKESPVFPTPFGRVGIVLCSERKNAALVRGICANGPDFLLCPSGGFFGPKANDPIVQARSKENKVPIVFVNPAQFLVTGPDGTVLVSEVLGDRFPITKAEEGGKKDVNRVYYHDLTLTPRPAGAKAKSTK
jgi:predicted amidohydrolase